MPAVTHYLIFDEKPRKAPFPIGYVTKASVTKNKDEFYIHKGVKKYKSYNKEHERMGAVELEREEHIDDGEEVLLMPDGRICIDNIFNGDENSEPRWIGCLVRKPYERPSFKPGFTYP